MPLLAAAVSSDLDVVKGDLVFLNSVSLNSRQEEWLEEQSLFVNSKAEDSEYSDYESIAFTKPLNS